MSIWSGSRVSGVRTLSVPCLHILKDKICQAESKPMRQKHGEPSLLSLSLPSGQPPQPEGRSAAGVKQQREAPGSDNNPK